MELYLIRHAEAYRLGERGVTADEDRALTEAGEAHAKQVGSGLQRRGVRPGLILASPLVRARQTADLLAAQWTAPAPEVRVCEELAPGGKRRKLARAVRDGGQDQVVVVGHEPDLGDWLGWLIVSKKAQLDLAKAGVACVRCDDEAGKGAGTLLWLVPPEWLG
jgi:phosphohistidine phosphatase